MSTENLFVYVLCKGNDLPRTSKFEPWLMLTRTQVNNNMNNLKEYKYSGIPSELHCLIRLMKFVEIPNKGRRREERNDATQERSFKSWKMLQW